VKNEINGSSIIHIALLIWFARLLRFTANFHFSLGMNRFLETREFCAADEIVSTCFNNSVLKTCALPLIEFDDSRPSSELRGEVWIFLIDRVFATMLQFSDLMQ
jgi:hypothetical protein